MKKFKIFWLFVVLLSFTSCSYKCFGIYFDTIIPLKIQNEQGENLLNSKYVKDSIKIYYLFSDGCVVPCEIEYNPEKKGFRMYDDVIEIFLFAEFIHTHNGKDYDAGFDTCTMYIQWNSQDIDTVVSTSLSIHSTKKNPLPNGYCQWNLYDKIYYNGKLIVSSWEDNQKKMLEGIYPTIIK